MTTTLPTRQPSASRVTRPAQVGFPHPPTGLVTSAGRCHSGATRYADGGALTAAERPPGAERLAELIELYREGDTMTTAAVGATGRVGDQVSRKAPP